MAGKADGTLKLIGGWDAELLGGGAGVSALPLSPGFMVIASLGMLKSSSWAAAAPVSAQTRVMSAYSLWSSAIPQRVPGACRTVSGLLASVRKKESHYNLLHPSLLLCVAASVVAVLNTSTRCEMSP